MGLFFFSLGLNFSHNHWEIPIERRHLALKLKLLASNLCLSGCHC